MWNLRPLVEIVFEDQLIDEVGFKESYKRQLATEERVKKMKWEAACRGMLLSFHPSIEGLKGKFFQEPNRPKRENMPVLKFKDRFNFLSEVTEMREPKTMNNETRPECTSENLVSKAQG